MYRHKCVHTLMSMARYKTIDLRENQALRKKIVYTCKSMLAFFHCFWLHCLYIENTVLFSNPLFYTPRKMQDTPSSLFALGTDHITSSGRWGVGKKRFSPFTAVSLLLCCRCLRVKGEWTPGSPWEEFLQRSPSLSLLTSESVKRDSREYIVGTFNLWNRITSWYFYPKQCKRIFFIYIGVAMAL